MKNKKKTQILLLSILSISMLIGATFIQTEVNSNKDVKDNFNSFIVTTSGYENPIEINATATGVGANNWSWAVSQSWCTGSGTEGDPYIIENLIIDGENSGKCIAIYNSEEHFIIRNCTVYNAGSDFWDAGIRLENVTNGKIIGNNCSNNKVGIYLVESSFNFLLTNLAFNGYSGIYLNDTCGNNVISENTLYNNTNYGVAFYALSFQNEECKDNTISRNLITENQQRGIFLSEADDNEITENTISNNSAEGIYLYNCDNTTIYKNYLIGNGLHAKDDSDPGIPFYDVNNWDNSIIGNYWDNYTGSDLDDNGIGDEDYTFILGSYVSPNDTLPIYGDPFHNGEKIHIDGSGVSGHNWAWSSTRAWCSGSGTSGDPYYISDLVIDAANDGSCILIGNSSSDYFKIENCTLKNPGITVSDACIELYNADYGIIYLNNLSLCDYGMYLLSSDNHLITNNTIYYNVLCIEEISSTGNTIENNTCIQPVTWDETPTNQEIEYNTDFQYDLNATSAAGIDHWEINDTDFAIDGNGIITNDTILSVGVHSLRVKAVDTENYYAVAIFNVNVSDPGPPIWIHEPTDEFLEYGDDYYFDANATDVSGIDYYELNDTTYFDITLNEGIITNKGLLALGAYSLEARAYDPYGYYSSANFTITVQDTTSPTITNVSSTKPDAAYSIGENIDIIITFSEPVDVTNFPQLELETGSTNAFINYASGSGTDTLTFTYVVASGHNTNDLEYVSTTALTLNGGTIKDSVGNDAIRTLPSLGGLGSLSYNKDIIIDTSNPTITDSQAGDDTWRNSAGTTYNVDFSDPAPSSTLYIAQYKITTASGQGGTILQDWIDIFPDHGTASYTTNWAINFAACQEGMNYVSVRVYDDAGNIATQDDVFYVYKDTSNPTITDSQAGDDTWRNSAGTTYNVDFSDPAPSSTLYIAQYKITTASGQGGTILQDWIDIFPDHGTASYTTNWAINFAACQEGINYVSVRVYDDAGNVATDDDVFYVYKDTAAPIQPIGLYADPSSWTNTDEFDLFWSNPSDLSGIAGVYYKLDSIPSSATDGTQILSPDIESILDLAVGTDGSHTVYVWLEDNAGNVNHTNRVSVQLFLDILNPSIINVTSIKADGTYGVGEIIDILVIFSEPVNITGTPQLTLETGSVNAVIDYSSGNLTNTLIFSYTVALGHTSLDLDYTSTSALSLNGGTIRDLVGNSADLTLSSPGGSGSLGDNKDIIIDTTSPSITNVTSNKPNGTYGVGEIIDISITFSEAVYVTGTPQLTLETGTVDAIIDYTSGSGTITLTFTYTVASGHTSSDLGYESINALSGTIRDVATNDANKTLPAPGATGSLSDNKDIILETISPTVMDVSSTKPDGTYGEGETINIIIDFSETVYVTGTPQLTLETGSVDAIIDYVSGNGTATLVFTYVVASGHNSEDLDYESANALSLNGGSIKDSVGNDAVLTLPAPGTAGSLSFNKNLIIETTVGLGIIGWTIIIGSGSAIALAVIIFAVVRRKRGSKKDYF